MNHRIPLDQISDDIHVISVPSGKSLFEMELFMLQNDYIIIFDLIYHHNLTQPHHQASLDFHSS